MSSDDELAAAKTRLEEALESYAKTLSEEDATLTGYIIQIVTSNINDLSRNWYSPVIRPDWQPYHSTLGLVEYVYRDFEGVHVSDDDD
jgi:hypothetical protein